MVIQNISTCYCLFDLTMASTFPVPYLQHSTDFSETPDVDICMGTVPTTLVDPVIRKMFYQLRENTWLMTAERIAGARFLVRDGCKIIVERVDSTHDDVLRLFLLGSCMGALLLQRQIVPLHGNALATEHGAIILAGATTAGKSTLTMALLQRGLRLLADDLSALKQLEGGIPLVQPGFPRLKLWADTCKQFGIDTDVLSRIRPELEKFHYPVQDTFCPQPMPLHSVYLLKPEPRDTPVIEPLTGVTKIKELQAQLYKMVFTEAQQNWSWLFGRIADIARHTRICLVRRPKDGFCIDTLADLITADLTR